MIRKRLNVGSGNLSYLDNEGAGKVLIGLHGHFGCASQLSFLGQVHHGRVILLDQRGHGNSDHFESYKTTDYVNDIKRLVDHEKIEKPIILGHSLGGVNAYRYAFDSQNVRALIIEDIGTEVDCSNEFIRKLPPDFGSLYDVAGSLKEVGLEFDHYFLESIRYDGVRWKFQFDYEDMVASQKEMNGDHWKYWTELDCSILLTHGTKSWACNTANIREMAEKNNHVTLRIYEGCGHTLHDESRVQFIADVKVFLTGLGL